jgi:hypothetical protein
VRNIPTFVLSLAFAVSAHAEPHFSTEWNTLIASDGPYVLQSTLQSTVDTGSYGAQTALWHDTSTGTDWAAVGAPSENSGAGAVYVYHRNSGATDWTSDTAIVAPDATANSQFGAAVALDGDTLVIGAPRHVNDLTVGAAYVFVRNSITGAWAQQGDELNARIGAFGGTVALHGDQMVIADPLLSRVYPYERSGGIWTALTPIEAPSEMFLPSFGAALWMSDTELLVGAPTDSHVKLTQGSCALYSRSRDGWDQQQVLRPTMDTSTGQFFCNSVAKSDRGIFVGAPRAKAGAGAFDVFVFDSADNRWIHQAEIPEPALDTTTPPLPLFGHSIAVDNDVLVAGTPGRDRAMVFRFSAGAWIHDSTLIGNTGSSFGTSVATAAGNVLAGASSDGDKGQGAAYVFIDDRIFADGVE